MRQSLVQTPFYRQILPWVFIAAFFAIAPVVVFLTAGYRFNEKKGLVEHTSTAIIDSTPSGATITIDGQSTPFKTPKTFQNILPGMHRFRVEKVGYFPYEKSIEANPERAIFLNAIRLWPNRPPIFLSNTTSSQANDITTTKLPDTRFPEYRIQSSTTTKNLSVLVTQDRVIALPSGTWEIVDRRNGHVILRSGTDWLSVDPAIDSPTIITATGETIAWLKKNGTDLALLKYRGEAWEWDVIHPPILLERQSEPLIGLTWDQHGDDIFLATKTHVISLNLDDRDGYLKTTIADFDEIWSIDADVNAITVMAKHGNQTGQWKLELN